MEGRWKVNRSVGLLGDTGVLEIAEGDEGNKGDDTGDVNSSGGILNGASPCSRDDLITACLDNS